MHHIPKKSDVICEVVYKFPSAFTKKSTHLPEAGWNALINWKAYLGDASFLPSAENGAFISSISIESDTIIILSNLPFNSSKSLLE